MVNYLTGFMNMSKRRIYALMGFLILIWGLDFVVVKNALEMLDQLTLLFYKLFVALVFVLIVRLAKEKGPLFRKKDILLFILSVLIGDVAYYYCEYSALPYMPVSLVSIIFSFVPIVSIIIEAIVYKRKTSLKVVAGVFVCILGIALIIGVDWSILLHGRLYGYLFSFACVFCWNFYNFVTASLHERYSTLTLTLNQLICACAMLFPYALHFSPPLSEFTPALTMQVLFLGLIDSGIGFLILVRALHELGPTTTALFSNFLPVTTTFFGWLFLSELISPMQFVGGAIVIAAGYYVIKEKDKSLPQRN